jgi:transposase-like protein
MQSSNWKWHLNEIFVKINGERHDLWRAVDHEGEGLESYVTKKRDKKAALKFMKKAMRRYGSPNEIVTDRLRSTVQQQKSWAVQISKLQSGGKITELRIHICRFDNENVRCCGSGVCTASKSSPQSTPRFTICSIRRGHSQLAVLSS